MHNHHIHFPPPPCLAFLGVIAHILLVGDDARAHTHTDTHRGYRPFLLVPLALAPCLDFQLSVFSFQPRLPGLLLWGWLSLTDGQHK